MKNIISISLVFLLSYKASSQNSKLYDEGLGEKFELSFACVKKTIETMQDCSFLLKLHNNTDTFLKVPTSYIASSYSSTGANFGYEIYWCNKKDTIDLTSNFLELINSPYNTFHNSRQIRPKEDLFLELKIFPTFFRKKGIYKIRFIYKAGIYNDGFQNVSTNWIYVDVKKEFTDDIE